MFATGRSFDANGTVIGTAHAKVLIEGLPKLFDSLLTFLPDGQSLSALSPAHPDGFRFADALQLWYADTETLPNWSWSTPLTCEAAISPTPGQLVTIEDTLLDPPPGSARYYVMASHSGAEVRLGRQFIASGGQ